MRHHVRLTPDEYRRQPDFAREIIDIDRRLEAERPAGNVVPLGRGELIRRRRRVGAQDSSARPDGGRPGGTPVALAG